MTVSFGGDKRDRTADLLNAIQALSQLSYTPIADDNIPEVRGNVKKKNNRSLHVQGKMIRISCFSVRILSRLVQQIITRHIEYHRSNTLKQKIIMLTVMN